MSECVCSRLSGFHHVKSYPTKGATFSNQDTLGSFQDLGDRRKKEVGEFGKCPALDNFI